MAGEGVVECAKLAESLAESLGIPSGLMAVVMVFGVGVVFIIVRVAHATEWIDRRRSSRIEALLAELSKPYTWKNALVLEQTFLRYTGKLIDHGDLISLLSRPDPSRSMTRYAALQKYARINYDNHTFEFREGYETLKARRWKRAAYTAAYFICAAVGALLGMRGVAKALSGSGGASFEALGIAVLFFVLAFVCIDAAEDIGAATRLVGQSAATSPATAAEGAAAAGDAAT